MAINFTRLLGINGVSSRERPLAVLWGRRLEWPILLVALCIPVEWYLEGAHIIRPDSVRIFDWIIWLVFLFETTLLTTLVRDKWHYLLTNWMNLVIIAAGVPIEWVNSPLIGALRNLRLLLMFYLLARLSRRLRQFLTKGRVGSVLLISLVVVALAGIIVTRLDPSMGTVWDGMWWAWVTLSHTGYGDIVPKNGAARFFGAMLIFLGIVLIIPDDGSPVSLFDWERSGKGRDRDGESRDRNGEGRRRDGTSRERGKGRGAIAEGCRCPSGTHRETAGAAQLGKP